MPPIVPPWNPAVDPTLTVVFLDSGQGDTNLVRFPNGQLMLIDAGSIKNSAVVLPQLVTALGRYVPSSGVIDWLVITHADQDHYNLLRGLWSQGITFNEIWYGCAPPLYQNALDHNFAYGLVTSAAAWSPGASFFRGHAPLLTVGGVELWMLAANASGDPTAATALDKNTNSIVLMLRFGAAAHYYRVFMMGDATAATEAFILGNLGLPTVAPGLVARTFASMLKMGHHGSDSSSSDPWITALTPTGMTISADTRLFSGTGMPKLSFLTHVVSLTALGLAIPHNLVVFNDTVHPVGWGQITESVAVCSTLDQIVFNADHTGYEANGCSWYLFVSQGGLVSLQTT